jgi:hypothetical protein
MGICDFIAHWVQHRAHVRPERKQPMPVERVLLRFLQRFVEELGSQKDSAFQRQLAVMPVQIHDRVSQRILFPASFHHL